VGLDQFSLKIPPLKKGGMGVSYRGFMLRLSLKLLALMLLASPASQARPHHADQFMGLLTTEPNKTKRMPMEFHGLHFTRDVDLVSCTSSTMPDKLSCQIVVKAKSGQTLAQAEVEFIKNNTGTKAALSLMRLNRKQQWLTRNLSLNQYVERPISAGDFEAILQQAQYFRLNNSFWPVLIRAVDVVVSKVTSISVTIIADASGWPLVEKELDDMVRSFSKKT
jgi:hypothetical protein